MTTLADKLIEAGLTSQPTSSKATIEERKGDRHEN